MKKLILTTALAVAAASSVFAAPEKYVLDSSHSQIVFSYNHLGFSTGYGMFSGFNGDIMFDQEDPAASSVNISIPVASMITGWEPRYKHLMSADFFGTSETDIVTFSSTSIDVTGDNTALITGDMTMNGITKSVVLDANLNTAAKHPMAGKDWAGFDATATVSRADFNVAKFAPFVGDAVEIKISIEAMKAE